MIIERLKEWSLLLLGFLVLFWFFTRTIGETFGLWLAFVAVMFLPGLLLAKWFLPDWNAWEQALLASFVGFGSGPLILYYLSVFGLTSVRVPFIIALALVSLVLILIVERKTGKENL
jgi:hypothetical protein